MQTSVARLYAHILNFFLSSLKWYKDNRAVHALKSIFQPWDLKFRHEYEAIAAETQQIRRLADVAMKAEVRDTRLEVVQGTRHWELVKQEMNDLKVENQRLTSLFQAKFGMLEDSMLRKWVAHFLGAGISVLSYHEQATVSDNIFFSTIRAPDSKTLTYIANRHVWRDPA